MTETQSGPGSNNGNNSDWNRQASTFDWEGWIAEENEADALPGSGQVDRERPAPRPAFPRPN